MILDRLSEFLARRRGLPTMIAILLVVVGYKVFDKLTPKLDFDELIHKGNVAMAIVIGSFILGLCHVVARVVSAILGG